MEMRCISDGGDEEEEEEGRPVSPHSGDKTQVPSPGTPTLRVRAYTVGPLRSKPGWRSRPLTQQSRASVSPPPYDEEVRLGAAARSE